MAEDPNHLPPRARVVLGRETRELRERALQLALESLPGVTTGQLIDRAVWFEQYLRTGGPSRPHHACREPECATPSGKTACHTCGEAWPCSTELRARA